MIDPSEFLNSISEPTDRAFTHRLDGLDRLIESIDKLTAALERSEQTATQKGYAGTINEHGQWEIPPLPSGRP
jgi:hypothetical protein